MVGRIRFLIYGPGALDRKTTEPQFVRSLEGMCIVVIENRAGSNMTVCEGRPAARIHIFMLSTAADLASNLVLDLPPDVRKIVEAHFFDGESIFKIQRRHGMKRKDLEMLIEAALVSMRMALRGRGVRAVADVI